MTDAALLARIHALEMRVAELERLRFGPPPYHPGGQPLIPPKTDCGCQPGTICMNVACPRMTQITC